MHRLLIVPLALAACSTESIIETATGGQVKIEGDKVSIKTDKGELVATQDGTMVITNEKGERATLASEGEGVRVETKDGSSTFSSKAVPKGFPLAIMDGSTVESVAHMTTAKKGDQFHLTLSTDKSAAEVATFYEKALKDKGLKVKRNDHKMGADMMMMLVGKKDKVEASITAMRGQNDKKTAVMIQWTPK